MDPNECLKKIVKCFENGWLLEGHDHCENLESWLDAGGFLPDAFVKHPELHQAFNAGNLCEFVEDTTVAWSTLL